MSSLSDNLFAAFSEEEAPEADPSRLGGLLVYLASFRDGSGVDLSRVSEVSQVYSEKVLETMEEFDLVLDSLEEREQEMPADFLSSALDCQSAFEAHLESLEELGEILEQSIEIPLLDETIRSLGDTGRELEIKLASFANWGHE